MLDKKTYFCGTNSAERVFETEFCMFGLGDIAITCAMFLCIVSAAICVIYGAVNWNSSDDDNAGGEK